MTPHIESVLRKAVEKLRVAEMLVANGAWDDAVSRAYYAAFHAISALHLSQGQTFSSHAQSIGRFNKDFVRTGMFSKEFTAILTRLFEDRQSGDYDVSGLVTAEEKARLPRQLVLDTARETVERFRHVWDAEKQHLPMASSVVERIDWHLGRVPLVYEDVTLPDTSNSTGTG